MDNTVGSIDINKLLLDSQGAYILGLWCSDGYHRTSSIGLSNTDEELLERFALFLLDIFPKNRLRIRAYHPIKTKIPRISNRLSVITENIVYYPSFKARQMVCHLYVNSRPLLRIFKLARDKIEQIDSKVITSYVAGRFDGDGSVNKKKDRDFRILYGNYKEAEIDQYLLRKVGIDKTRIYHYKQAKTFCLYVLRQETANIIELLSPFSNYLQKLIFITP
ncbi:MAG: hypothetical protein A3I88_03180 [Candidatus Portnoybacteria bacterium RIFCSPLOWO2_12_FULL_39_9]|uniref:DOD-type homing endonuclease domain-containing protein n=1 Tax=Candidatus Portnoybacteria bacterium RIFCSPHIGHO2_12_FULL_38_9 TaxID=1801997 RepID=A0A1G2FF71_9BACT|nr:MAG: LAGLIDADG homing endonuclease [Parcubacteria group bacterium GW2011_GWF2_38_8]OGZ36726.1 MAG: hypothetical protein A3J64_03285 [Candidatus Portnoybacteria bacterium RIFCSPHIGHO2_12_FULL_38_9]OGZ38085.1 MAG: hypothetical protein A3F21_00885 [Candidatus Portnoybacteria bacterium RIFCSPLOWO2_01_FULL_38_39]OGZ40092.1 MAG: hypothetical protein A3I88_03180 [Candidatus Portnoybacteria bacterium RIFCSPLOWO2_12_FULL_39_9]